MDLKKLVNSLKEGELTMEGIHILNTTVVMEHVIWYVPVIISCVVLTFIGLTFLLESFNGILQGIGAIVATVSFIALVAIALFNPTIETDRNRYEVIIDESVSLVDVYEKYDVIDQRGEIWVLEDKESE